jgi:hypothetical protein
MTTLNGGNKAPSDQGRKSAIRLIRMDKQNTIFILCLERKAGVRRLDFTD